MADTDSWWMKLARAEKHMEEIKGAARAYASLHGYEWARVRKPKNQNENVVYECARIDPPDPGIALMVGDCMHNLRSALDHIVVASVKKGDRTNATSFPFESVNQWEMRPDGNFVIKDSNRRQEFERAIYGLPFQAKALIVQAQPYLFGANAERAILNLISRIDNADKHRELAVIAGGLRRVYADFTFDGVHVPEPRRYLLPTEFAHEGTILGWTVPAEAMGIINPRKVEMKHRGIATIFIQIKGGGRGRNDTYGLYRTLNASRYQVRWMLKALQPFAIHK